MQTVFVTAWRLISRQHFVWFLSLPFSAHVTLSSSHTTLSFRKHLKRNPIAWKAEIRSYEMLRSKSQK